MRYTVFHIISGKPRQKLENLREEIEKEFTLLQTHFKSPSHITLKYDFETDNIEPIEEILEKVCSRHKPVKLKLSGIETFSKKVIFLKVEENSQFKRVYKDLYKKLKVVKWLTWEPFEGENYKPHYTLAHKQLTEENFDDVLNYVRNKKIKININFDNLAIMRLKGKERKIHKLYRLA